MSGLFRHPPQPQQRQAKLVQETAPAGNNTISSADLTFGFSESATLAETFSASGGVAFGFSEAAVLTETFSLAGSEAFGFAESASLGEAFSLSAGLSFPFAESAALSVPVTATTGFSGNKRVSPYTLRQKQSHLYADLSFGFGITARLKETDDELALVLGAF